MLDLDTRGDFGRHRRLRQSEGLRRLTAETRLSASDFVYPLFVTHGQGVREEIPSMPGQFRISLDQVGREAEDLRALGIPAVLLFGLPAMKDEQGSEAYDDGGIVQDAVRAFKEADPDARRHHRRLPVRVHEPRPLRRHRRRRGGQRPLRSTCSRARRCRTRGPAPTWSRRRT